MNSKSRTIWIMKKKSAQCKHGKMVFTQDFVLWLRTKWKQMQHKRLRMKAISGGFRLTVYKIYKICIQHCRHWHYTDNKKLFCFRRVTAYMGNERNGLFLFCSFVQKWCQNKYFDNIWKSTKGLDYNNANHVSTDMHFWTARRVEVNEVNSSRKYAVLNKK